MRFEALGPLQVLDDGGPVALRPAQRRVLAALLLTPDAAVSVDTLIDRMWGESPPDTARRAIHVHLSGLRQRIPGAIRAGADGYMVDLERHDLDIPEFSVLAARAGRRLAQGRFRDAADTAARASRLWRGEPFPELADLDSARGERDRLLELFVGTRTTEARALTLQGRISEAIALLRGLVADHPLDESLWEELVLAYCMAGRTADARATLASARSTLRAELAVPPGPRLQDLEERVLREDPDLVGVSGAVVAHNLPSFESTFVGRDEDLEAVAEMINGHRLVTITGPPGIGKTRLAIEVASRRLDVHPAGVWLIRLGGAHTETDVLATLSSVMGVAERADDLDQLHRRLALRPALIVLDECEHVLDAVRLLLTTRLRGDRLHILATSRTRLGVIDEIVWPLRPLSVPDAEDGMWESTTLQLLVDRVAAMDPTIDLAAAIPDELIDVCRRTGGMPLAVELAARLTRSLGLGRVGSLGFVRDPGRPGPVPPHDASVADAIGRSVDLLDEADRRHLDAAAVFATPFTAAAFGQVCVRDGDRAATDDAIYGLVEASLITPEPSSHGTVRYRMLEPVRDFGIRRLAGRQLLRVARDRHAEWFIDAARITAEAGWSSAEAAALDAAEESIGDFRTAMRHLLDTGRPREAAGIAAGLSQFWVSRFLAWEGQRWLAECLAYDIDDESRIDILAAASGVAFFVGRYDESAALSQQVLDLAVTRGDRSLEARALYGIGRVELHRRPPEGFSLIDRAIAIYQEIGDRVAAAECRVAIGMQAAYAGDRRRAEAVLSDATALLEAEDYPRIASVGHRYLSLAAWHDDDEPVTRGHLDRALHLAAQANDRRVLSGVLSHKALVEGRWGDPEVAAGSLREALGLIAGQNGIYFTLTAFAALPLLVLREDWSLAARLLAHFDQVHRDFGWIPLDERNVSAPAYRAQVAAGLAATHTRPDMTPVPTPVMADLLTQWLDLIAQA